MSNSSVEELLNSSLSNSFFNDNVEYVEAKIFSNHVSMSVGSMEKPIAIMDFINLLEKSFNRNESILVPYSLPPNVVKFGVNGSSLEINCYYPSCRKEITHLNNTYNIITPNVILYFQLGRDGEKWKTGTIKYLCTDLSLGELNTDSFYTSKDISGHIWVLPVTNVYEDGHMCFGGNTTPTSFTNNLRGLDWYFQLLFNSPFNNDLGVRSLAHSQTPKQWFTRLQDCITFPYEDLVEYQGSSVASTFSSSITVNPAATIIPAAEIADEVDTLNNEINEINEIIAGRATGGTILENTIRGVAAEAVPENIIRAVTGTIPGELGNHAFAVRNNPTVEYYADAPVNFLNVSFITAPTPVSTEPLINNAFIVSGEI